MCTSEASLSAWIALMVALDAFFNACLMGKSYIEDRMQRKLGNSF